MLIPVNRKVHKNSCVARWIRQGVDMQVGSTLYRGKYPEYKVIPADPTGLFPARVYKTAPGIPFVKIGTVV